MKTGWQELYLGGSPLAEARRLREFADQIKIVQARIKKGEHAARVMRAFHPKIHAGIMNATFRVLPELPPELAGGFFTPNALYQDVVVRFSNASPRVRPDAEKDLRGVALRVRTSAGAHDFLMTDFPVSHARNAEQFMVAARAGAHRSKLRGLLTLIFGLGPFQALRMVRALRAASKKVDSLATDEYWSRAPIAFGDYAMQYMLRPARVTPPAVQVDDRDPNYLRAELRARLAGSAVRFEFCVIPWIDDAKTPIERGDEKWDSAPVAVAELEIPAQDLSTDEARETESTVDLMQFNPWRTEQVMRPLGSMNRARKLVYSASSAHWSGRAVAPPQPGILSRLYSKSVNGFFGIVNRLVVWYRLPTWLAVINLYALRNQLRKHNLHDTSTPVPVADPTVVPLDPSAIVHRTFDGSGNDLAEPAMGSAGTRFGRNTPIPVLQRLIAERRAGTTDGWLLTPNPRTISWKLLTRSELIPATTLNLLAAAWIQFQTHDWFNHGKPLMSRPLRVPLDPGDPWEWGEMLVPRTPPDSTRSALDGALNPVPTFRNAGSHWWDGSQIYGSDERTMDSLRERKGGRLKLAQNMLPLDNHGMELSGFTDNWWLGLSLLHTLFALEHNAICDRLHRHNPDWDDERLFHMGRVILTALLAKIHTVEWTPAILGHPALKIAMGVNWWGLTGERFKRYLGRLSESEAISGIMGSPPEHGSAPFTLTEEFVSVYRMHPLLPDRIPLRGVGEDEVEWIRMEDYLAGDVQNYHKLGFDLQDLAYSFGRTHPGAITLHNHPRFLQNLAVTGGQAGGRLDLGTVDIIRDRERAVPRYNDFRQMVHLPRLRSFDDFNPKHARELHAVYNGKVDLVDPMIGMYSEAPPPGFGFSDTAFRIFILMASRRLKSDRFFTTDYSRDVYTQVGLDWIDDNDMSSILIRHFPELGPALHGLGNAFVPWKPLGSPVPQTQPAPAGAPDAQPGAPAQGAEG